MRLPKYYRNSTNTQPFVFGRQLLYSSNTTSTIATNPTVLSSTIDKINCTSNHFWDSLRHEHVVNLSWDTTNIKIKYKELKRRPDTFWELPLTGLLPSRDSEIRWAIVRIARTNAILKRPVNKFFPIETYISRH